MKLRLEWRAPRTPGEQRGPDAARQTVFKYRHDRIQELEAAMAHSDHGLLKEAEHMCYTVQPAMLKVRNAADDLEALVADDLWPLPTYQEMLFIK